MDSFKINGQRVAEVFDRCIDVAAALPDNTLSHLVVETGPPLRAVFEISPFTPDVYRAEQRTLAVIDGHTYADEVSKGSRSSNITAFPDGTQVKVREPREHLHGIANTDQPPDAESPSLAEGTVTALRQVGAYVGRLASPVMELRVGILNQAVFRDNPAGSPILAELRASFESPAERTPLEEWLQGTRIIRQYRLGALFDRIPRDHWEVKLVEGDHPMYVKLYDYSPEGVAAQRAALKQWNKEQ